MAVKVKEQSRQRLFAGAGRFLCERAVGALRAAMSPEQIAGCTGDSNDTVVSPDTAYRLWGTDRGQVLLDTAEQVSKPSFSGFQVTLNHMLDEYKAGNERAQQGSFEAQRQFFEGLLAINIELQFGSIGVPGGWALQGAALSSSLLWEGPRPPDDLADLGRRILAIRGAFYDVITQEEVDLLRRVMTAFGRRPRYGLSIEKIVRLMHAFHDGLVLRAFIDPALNDPSIGDGKRRSLRSEYVAEAAAALFDLAWAYTQEGSLVDPRHPGDDDEVAAKMFDDLVDAAIALYVQGRSVVEPSDAAHGAGVPDEAVALIFHDPGDLADSVVRRLVAAAGMEFGNSTYPLEMIESALLNLYRAARDHPAAVAAAGQLSPTHPPGAIAVLDEMVDSIAAALSSSAKVQCADPAGMAKTLVSLATKPDCWNAVKQMVKELAA